MKLGDEFLDVVHDAAVVHRCLPLAMPSVASSRDARLRNRRTGHDFRFVSSSPTTRRSLPCSRAALSTLDEAEYWGPSGHPIHCSFHQILSMRLSWHPAYETAAL